MNLDGIYAGPGQHFGAVRLVPLFREQPVAGLRLHPNLFPENPCRDCGATYVPHGFTAVWTKDGSPVAAYGTQLADAGNVRYTPTGIEVRFRRRAARRADPHRARFLPVGLSYDGLLLNTFGLPAHLWERGTLAAVQRGLSTRDEIAYAGGAVPGLDDALRVFEIHPGQTGVLLFLGDSLASALVVPHQDDYRALHTSLLLDLYGELLYEYTYLYPSVPAFTARIDETRIRDVADLRREVRKAAYDWNWYADVLADGLLGPKHVETVGARLGRFEVRRLRPAFRQDSEQHLGELIRDDATGAVAYLKTLRLSAAQARRGHLIGEMQRHDWHLAKAAKALGTDVHSLRARLARSGLDGLARP